MWKKYVMKLTNFVVHIVQVIDATTLDTQAWIEKKLSVENTREDGQIYCTGCGTKLAAIGQPESRPPQGGWRCRPCGGKISTTWN